MISLSFLLVFSCSYIISSNDTKSLTINQDIEKIRTTGNKFYPIISFGQDEKNNVHGIWFILNADKNITAFYSRDPNNGCNLSYRRDIKVNNFSPVFFNEFGEQLSNQIKQLDEFEVRTLEETVEVSINQVKYGICNQNNAIDELYCSTISVSKYGKPKLGRQIGQR